jgi:predicted alpha-1,2-mannosidase
MKIKLILILFFSITISVSAQQNFTQYVNPFIGTGGHGHTFPGATMPFAMVQLSPDTRIDGSWDGCSGYHYSDSMIYGFSHTHLSGTGCSDYGDIAFLPTFVDKPIEPYTKLYEKFAIPFSHKNEKATAGFYSVKMKNEVEVKLTSTLRCGMQTYKYPRKGYSWIKLDLTHRDELLEGSIVEEKTNNMNQIAYSGIRRSKAWASNQELYYYITINKKPIEQHIKTGANGQQQLIMLFAVDNKNAIIIKTGISGVDIAGAKNNLEKEMPDWIFEKYKKLANDEWNKELGKIEISQLSNESMAHLESEKQANEKLLNLEIEKLNIFYTALYHCMIHPSIYNDVDNRYRGRDNKIHHTEGKFNYYTVFSLWDTYRALHPLLTIIDKKRTNDFINTFIKQYEQCGRLPVWELWGNETNCMIGYHAVSVIWDAYNKGIRDYDVNKAFEAMKSIATQAKDYIDLNSKTQNPNSKEEITKEKKSKPENLEFGISNIGISSEARARCADGDALESYCKYGYVRADDSHESVSKTLEYAYDDWCIAQMANALNSKEDYEYYTNRSHNWMNVYDPTTGFMRARKNSTLYEPFSPYTVDNNYTEANSWQYSFYVPHDLIDLVNLQGGNDKFEKKLDDLFNAKEKTEGREQADITGLIGQYAHGNEPSHQIAYLYNYIGKPEKTKKIVDKIMNEFYTNKPDGLIGNEDCGQMSAWYVLNRLNMYPIVPGYKGFDFLGIDTNTANITIDGVKPTVKKCIIKPMTNNYENVLAYENIINYSNYVNDSFKKTDYNFEEEFVANPFIYKSNRIFKDNMEINILDGNESEGIKYSIDNGKTWQHYKTKLKINESTNILYYHQSKLFRTFTSCGGGNAQPPVTPIHGPMLFGKETEVFEYVTGSHFIRQQFNEPFTKKNNKKEEDKLEKIFYSKKSPIQTATFTKLPNDRKIILKNEYSKSYHAGGAEGLMDGIYGKLNWRAGDWQGYQGQDVEVIMKLNEVKEIYQVNATFLQDQNSWIFFPKEITFSFSIDGINWIDDMQTLDVPKDVETSIKKVSLAEHEVNKSFKAKYIKLIAKNFGPMPEWHEGRGNPTYIFIDEFLVK